MSNRISEFLNDAIPFISVIVVIFLLFRFCGTSSKPAKTSKSKKNDTSYLVVMEEEKIAILSNINNIGYDTAFDILNFYCIENGNIWGNSGSGKKSIETINVLSTKFQLPKKFISQLIYMFLYNGEVSLPSLKEGDDANAAAEAEQAQEQSRVY